MNKTYVMYTGSGKEHSLLITLKSYVLLPEEEAFSPTVLLKKRFHGEDRMVDSILFPGYVFIRTSDPQDLYRRIADSKGRTIFKYVRMLKDGEYIAPIYPDEEEMIRKICGDGHQGGFSYGYKTGDEIVITEGPLVSLQGKIESINRHKKTARVSLKLLNRQVDVTLGLEIVTRAPENGQILSETPKAEDQE